MSFRASLKNLIRRDPAASLRERAADLQARIPAPKPAGQAPIAFAEPAAAYAEQVAQAGASHDVLAASGIDHRDGTVSYCDAAGRVSRRPLASWLNFNAQQMHSRVQGEMGRRRILEGNPLPATEYADWEARIRRELRADAVADLAFRPERSFKATQDLRSGAEPISPSVRAAGDAELLALSSEWERVRDAYANAIQRQETITEAAKTDGHPGPAPAGSGPDWEAWFERAQAWRERTGVEAAEEASREACRALGEIEDRIAELPAASLAGLRLKARVAQRCDDIELEWPDKLGEGLARDLLAFTAGSDVDWHAPPPGFMASPAIDPVSFAQVAQGLQIELQRLRGIAWAEYHRLTENLRESIGEDEVRAHRARVRADLFLPALTAAVDPGSVEASALAALGRTAGPDPVLALIEEHRAAYAEWDRLSDVWNEMLESDPGYAEAMAASDEPGKRESAAFDALFAARPTTLPGVAAFAEYLREATNRTSTDLVPSAGERGLAAVAAALHAVLATREERSRRETSLVGMLDLASATMDELQTVRDLAERIGGVAYTHAWGPRCRSRTHPSGAPDYNVAGKLVQWIGDALTTVESAAENEAQRRTPTDRDDRETRLSMLAVSIIDNGDPETIEELACELLAHAKVERGQG